MNKVTIGIFVHDDFEFLKRTIKSLKKNTTLTYELIIVDDGSDDTTNSLLRKLNNITLITNMRRMGASHCANLVLDNSDSPYIIFLDSACYVVKDALSMLTDTLQNDLSFGIAGPSTNLAWGKQCIMKNGDLKECQIEKQGRLIHEQWGNKTEQLNVLHNVSSFCYAFRRDVFYEIGYFDEAYGLGQCEEIDYTTRAYKAGFKAVWVCGAYVHRFKKQRYGENAGILLQRNKEIYQEKFCCHQVNKTNKDYCCHCIGEECDCFIRPANLKKVFRAPVSYKIKQSVVSQCNTRSYVQEDYPLISCIMPTADRPEFASKAIELFLKQDYKNKELIIVDDGNIKIKDLVPVRSDILYIDLNTKTALGEKRNLAIKNANGRIITHWDDDDWYSTRRLRIQMNALRKKNADICALKPGLYFDIMNFEFWKCKDSVQEQFYYEGVIGGSMLYYKELWERYVKFPPSAALAEDAYFLKKLPRHIKLVKLDNKNCYVYIRHDNNTWQFNCGKDFISLGWTRTNPPGEITSEDLEFYRSLTFN